MLGKLSTHEFAIGGPSFDLPLPPARNPWNPTIIRAARRPVRAPGVAAGLFPMALGSDTGGTVRNPASCCGIVGLKPTYGLVSRRGVFPLSFTLDHVGPMTRTVADNALMLDAIAGHDPLDPGSAARRPRAISAACWTAACATCAWASCGISTRSTCRPHPEVTAAIEHAARVLQAEGAEVRDVTLPSLNEFAAVNRVILRSEAWSIHGAVAARAAGRLRPARAPAADAGRVHERRRLCPGAAPPAADDRRGRGRVPRFRRAASAPARWIRPAASTTPAETGRTYPRQARTPFNVTGHPALAMMAGLSATGLPLSVQFVGRYFDEATVLQVARAWEQASGVDGKHPPIV